MSMGGGGHQEKRGEKKLTKYKENCCQIKPYTQIYNKIDWKWKIQLNQHSATGKS